MTLGRWLRATGKVKRGIGSIRQDVNISVNPEDGFQIFHKNVVEVKGVQQLDQLEKIIEYEAKRQHGLLLIAKKLNELRIAKDFDWAKVLQKESPAADVTAVSYTHLTLPTILLV